MILNKKLISYVESMACKKRQGEKNSMLDGMRISKGNYSKHVICNRQM